MKEVFYMVKPEVWMPFVLIVLLLGFILTGRYMKYLERMEMIRRGLIPNSSAVVSSSSSSTLERLIRLYAGAILTAIGLAFTVVLTLANGVGEHLVVGAIPLAVGLALLLIHVLAAQR